jgi:cytochrome P450
MADGAAQIAEEARARAYATPLDQFHVADVELFTGDTFWPYFERLRAEDPVHYTAQSEFGPYWSVTLYNDIVRVESDPETFSSSSANGGITLFDGAGPTDRTNFISLDPPEHDAQRKVVAPMFSTASVAGLEGLIRERAGKILDELPIGETFDFVDKVSIELTSQMLATLFDFPFEERRLLPKMSDMILSGPTPDAKPEELAVWQAEAMSILGRFTPLWSERASLPLRNDLISMLAHGESTRKNNDPTLYFGNIILLIVAGSDTTRHSITGGLIALNENPGEYDKLRADPAVIPSMVPEIIRWQSPVAYMRRTAMTDAEVGGKQIRKGDKVAMWYVSGNRDESAIENAGRFIIDRERPRQHVSFGFGIHRCLGQRLAEMQLGVVWQEIMKRFPLIEITGPPRRLRSNFVKGYEALPVRIPERF